MLEKRVLTRKRELVDRRETDANVEQLNHVGVPWCLNNQLCWFPMVSETLVKKKRGKCPAGLGSLALVWITRLANVGK